MFSQRIVEYDCYFCDVCRDYVYDESVGDPYIGIVAKIRVENLPLWWKCPKCGASKESLRASTLFDDFVCETVQKNHFNKEKECLV